MTQYHCDSYELDAHVHLGFQAVQIFGVTSITASIKQIVAYVIHFRWYYGDCSQEEEMWKCAVLWWPYSCGAVSKHQYQEQVIEQQFKNELQQMIDHETTPQKSSSAKAARKQMADPENTCRKKLVG